MRFHYRETPHESKLVGLITLLRTPSVYQIAGFWLMLQSFGRDLWLADGPTVVAAAGFHYPTRMSVIRLSTGALMVLSPVALDKDLRTAVMELGVVRHIVAPTKLHNLSLNQWQAAFPDAQVHAAPGLRERRPDLKVDAELGAEPNPDWRAEVDQVILRNRIADEVVFFHRPSGTVVFTDLLQELPKGWFTGWRALVAWADGMTGTEPAVPRKFRLAFTNRADLAAGLAHIRSWPIRQVVMAHGRPVTVDAAALVDRAFAWARS